MAKIVGIDLGTTNSVVTVVQNGTPTVIPTAEGGNTCPSIVAFSKTGEILVGQVAKRQAIVNPENTVYSIKRFMGRLYDEVAEERKIVPYQVVAGPEGDARILIPKNGKTYTPQEISAMILQKLKRDAEAYLGEPVNQAVITVPAYFNDRQRQATKDAGRIAGLEVMRIINEPTAAALAYGLDEKEHETILVWDLGGGTFDVSVLEVGEGIIEVRSTNGDTHLGGDDWDQRVVEWMVQEFKKEQGIDLSKDRMALQRLREAAEKAKIELSATAETDVNLPFISANANGPQHLQLKLSRAKFDEMTKDLLERCVGPFEQAIKDAKLQAKDLTDVVLVGGSIRMPMVQSLVRRMTGGKEPHKGVNPDEVVAIGASLQGAVLTGEVKDVVLLDVTPLSLGIETKGGVMTVLSPRNTTIPVRKTEVFTTADDNQTAVDVKIYQGERPLMADNTLLGEFRLEGIPPAPRSVPQVEVTFDIDTNGILNVSAKDKASGKEQKVTITASTNLSKQDVERLVKEAESHASDDRRRRELAEARNQADSVIYRAEKVLHEANNLSEADKIRFETSINDLRQAMSGDDLARIRQLTQSLEQVVLSMSAAMPSPEAPYAPTPGSEGSGAQQTGNPPGNNNTVDGDFREM